MNKVLLSIEDALEATGVKRTTLYDLLRTQQLESIRIGRRRLIPAEALDAFVQRLRDESRGQFYTGEVEGDS